MWPVSVPLGTAGPAGVLSGGQVRRGSGGPTSRTTSCTSQYCRDCFSCSQPSSLTKETVIYKTVVGRYRLLSDLDADPASAWHSWPGWSLHLPGLHPPPPARRLRCQMQGAAAPPRPAPLVAEAPRPLRPLSPALHHEPCSLHRRSPEGSPLPHTPPTRRARGPLPGGTSRAAAAASPRPWRQAPQLVA